MTRPVACFESRSLSECPELHTKAWQPILTLAQSECDLAALREPVAASLGCSCQCPGRLTAHLAGIVCDGGCCPKSVGKPSAVFRVYSNAKGIAFLPPSQDF